MSGVAPSNPASPPGNEEAGEAPHGLKKARVLYDYDAKDATELSLMADEIVLVCDLPNKRDDDYLMGARGQQRGKVPKAFLEIIS